MHALEKARRWLLMAGALFWTGTALPVQIVTDSANVACEEFLLSRELKVYKDPTLFLSNMAMIYADPVRGWETLMHENPLLTTLRGTARLMQLGSPREFRNFGSIARLYELNEPRLRAPASGRETKGRRDRGEGELRKGPTMIVPIKICGTNDPYSDTLGFVLVEDLKEAQQENLEEGGLPPSTYPNPIPKLRKDAPREREEGSEEMIKRRAG